MWSLNGPKIMLIQIFEHTILSLEKVMANHTNEFDSCIVGVKCGNDCNPRKQKEKLVQQLQANFIQGAADKLKGDFNISPT